MTITKDLLLYFIRDRKLDEQSEITQKQEFSGIQHWIADVRKLKREYLYLCDGNRVPDIEEKLDKDICLLVIFPNDQDTEPSEHDSEMESFSRKSDFYAEQKKRYPGSDE